MKTFLNQRNVCAALALMLGLTVLGFAAKQSHLKKEIINKEWLSGR